MDKSMTVALELQPCCGNRSGIGTYAYELAKRLGENKDIQFYGRLFDFRGKQDINASIPGLPFQVEVCKLFPYGVYRRIWDFVPIRYNSLFHDTDLNLFFDYIVPPRITGKVITTIHDMTFVRFPDLMKESNRRRIEKDILYSVERSDRVVTISDFSKREIMELLHVPEEKIDIVSPASPDIRVTAKKKRTDDPYILFVGTVEPRKNIVRLIRAFEILKIKYHIPHKLIISGKSGWKSEDIYQEADASNYASQIIFTGFVDEIKKRELYVNTDVFVFPSLYEGFGIPPLEAMAFGCPVVTSNSASLPEVAGNAAELVDPMDEQSIAEGIWKVLSDKVYADDLIQRGYEQIKKFTWAASAEKLAEICKSVLGA